MPHLAMSVAISQVVLIYLDFFYFNALHKSVFPLYTLASRGRTDLHFFEQRYTSNTQWLT